MATFLMTWNPNNYPWDDIDDCIQKVSTHGHFRRHWSCGRSKKPSPGDRFFVLQQKVKPRGITASGYITSEPYIDISTHNKSGWSRFVKVVFDVILNPKKEDILPRHRLDEPDLSKAHWNAQGSGTQIPDVIAKALDEEWRKFTKTDGSELLNVSRQLVEGARQEIYTTVYERNPKARTACLEAHGYSCVVCGFNFENVFGAIGKEFIHVHHVKPLFEIGDEYSVDPINDLKPVCPNCHAMLHRLTDEGFMSIEDLRDILKRHSHRE